MLGEPHCYSYVRDWQAKLDQLGWWHSFELPDGTRVAGVNSIEGLKQRLARFPIAENLHGKRVLDIGAWDGWFSFEMERRGAEVVAVDCWDNPRFRLMRSMLRSQVDYRVSDVYDLSPAKVGQFDIVLFLGVLYHLAHPLLGLERVCALTRDVAAVNTFVVKDTDDAAVELARNPAMQFYETDELGGRFDNWTGPNTSCVMAMCRTAGFARVDFHGFMEHSAFFMCHRSWVDEPHVHGAPRLLGAVHAWNRGIHLRTDIAEYVFCSFEHPAAALSTDDVQAEVGPFGVRPVGVAKGASGEWICNFRVPPGTPAGSQHVRVRVRGSDWSNAGKIIVDSPCRADELTITGLADGTTWRPGELDLSKGDVISLWVNGFPADADVGCVRVWIGDEPAECLFVGAEGQVNARMAVPLPAGDYRVAVTCGGPPSEAATLRISR